MASRREAMKSMGLSSNPSEEEVTAFHDRLNQPRQNSSDQHSNPPIRGPPQGHTGHSYGQVVGEDDDESEDYEDDEYESDEEYESDSEYIHVPYRGQVDANGNYVEDGGAPEEAQDNCYCPRCIAIRKAAKQQDKAAKLEAARRRKALRDAARAEAAAKEEEDRHLQKVDPKSSLAWKRGGESREKLIRQHFLAQTPQLLLHWAGNDSLIVLLDVPDISLLTEAKLPPKGVDWEVSYKPEHGSKWANIVAAKEYDNVCITKLLPGTAYAVKCRMGLSGALTWSGATEWGPWSATQQYKTTGTAPADAPQQQSSAAAAAASKSGGKKKKKNRDAAFAKLIRQEDQQAAAEDEQSVDGRLSDGTSEGGAADGSAAGLDPDSSTKAAQEGIAPQAEAEQAGNRAHSSAAAQADQLTADEAAAAAFFGIKAAARPAAAAGAAPPAASGAAKKAGKSAAATGSKAGSGTAAGSKQAAVRSASPAAAAAHVERVSEGAAGAGSSSSSSQHRPVSNTMCKYFAQGKCHFGNSCRFVHEQPASRPCDDDYGDSAAAAAELGSGMGEDSSAPSSAAVTAEAGTAAAAKRDRAALERLLPCTNTGHHIGLREAREVIKLAARLSARLPVARYQPAPVTAEGLYLKPLFLSTYDVTGSCYAAWYRHLEAAASSSQAAGRVQPRIQSKPAAATVKARMAAAMKDQQQPADIPTVAAAPAPAASPAAAPAPAQQQQASSSSVSQRVHKPKFSSTCKFFAQGTCKFGSSCAFVHPLAKAGTAAAATAASAAAAAPDSSAWYDSGFAAPAGGSYNQQHSVPLLQQQQQQQQQPQQQAAPSAGQMPSYLGHVPHAMSGFEQQQATADVSNIQQQPQLPYQQQEHYVEQQYGQQQHVQQQHGQQQYSQQQYSQQQYSQQQYSQQQYSQQQYSQQQYGQQQYGQQQPPYQPPLQQQQPSTSASYPQSIPPAGPYDPYSY